MSKYSLTVYRTGRFTSEIEPPWRSAAREFAEPGTSDWPEAIGNELDCDGIGTAVRNGDVREAEVVHWEIPDGCHYVEFYCRYQLVDAVLVPRRQDWLRFYTAFVMPYMRTHAAIAIVAGQQRIASVLISRARHGGGAHIDQLTGASELDARAYADHEPERIAR